MINNRIVFFFLKKTLPNKFIFILENYICFYFILNRIKYKGTQNRVSIVNTHDKSGGASKIAFQLGYYLKSKLRIHFYVKNKILSFDWISEIKERPFNLIESMLMNSSKDKGWIEFAGLNALSLLHEKEFLSSKIVHLHNLHGEFFSPFLLKQILKNKKVLWTLHDEFLITGHCGFSMKCERWQKGCGDCPDLEIFPAIKFDNTKLVLKYKVEIIKDLNPVLVSPSIWLAERVKKIYGQSIRVEIINNGIDVNVFKPFEKSLIRKKLGLPIDKKIILFIAEYATNNPFKGGEIIRNLIQDNDLKHYIFMTVGGEAKFNLDNHIVYPYINNDLELAELYSAADVLLYPTQADNFPLVVLESMACGTPVITSNLGGIPEIISNNHNGFLIEKYTSSIEFKKKLIEFFLLEKSTLENIIHNGIKKVNNNFTINQMINSYMKLYQE